MTTPIKARADFTTVDGLVSRLNTLQTKSIVAPEPTALAEYGLDKPETTIQLGSGSSQATLLIGKAAGEGAVYAKDQSRPAVITIDVDAPRATSPRTSASTGRRISSTPARSTRRASK